MNDLRSVLGKRVGRVSNSGKRDLYGVRNGMNERNVFSDGSSTIREWSNNIFKVMMLIIMMIIIIINNENI